jgi:hypothetical protein
MYGTDYRYARTRLIDTVVQNKEGKPFKVEEITNDGVMIGCDLSGERVVSPLDESILQSHKLGFVNMGGRAVYVVRKSLRNDWRQGLRPNNVIGICERGCINVRFREIMLSIEGSYVKLDMVEQSLQESISVPISRSFAVNNNGQVIHGVSGVVGLFREGKLAFTKGFEKFKEVFLLEVGDEGIEAF